METHGGREKDIKANKKQRRRWRRHRENTNHIRIDTMCTMARHRVSIVTGKQHIVYRYTNTFAFTCSSHRFRIFYFMMRVRERVVFIGLRRYGDGGGDSQHTFVVKEQFNVSSASTHSTLAGDGDDDDYSKTSTCVFVLSWAERTNEKSRQESKLDFRAAEKRKYNGIAWTRERSQITRTSHELHFLLPFFSVYQTQRNTIRHSSFSIVEQTLHKMECIQRKHDKSAMEMNRAIWRRMSRRMEWTNGGAAEEIALAKRKTHLMGVSDDPAQFFSFSIQSSHRPHWTIHHTQRERPTHFLSRWKMFAVFARNYFSPTHTNTTNAELLSMPYSMFCVFRAWYFMFFSPKTHFGIHPFIINLHIRGSERKRERESGRTHFYLCVCVFGFCCVSISWNSNE